MDINRKKVLFLPLDVLTQSESPKDITEFRVRTDIVDRIKSSRIARVAIVSRLDYPFSKSDMKTLLKTMEFFVFSYCQVAVSSHYVGNFFKEVLESLPNNLKHTEHMLVVDRDSMLADELDIDYMNLNDFLV